MNGLRDRLQMRTRVLFVGINPGLTSARVGHHFAGPSNRFWRLLFDSGLTPERLRPEDDHRLVTWGYGLTNLVPRATAGIDTLRREEFLAALPALRRKVAPAASSGGAEALTKPTSLRRSGVRGLMDRWRWLSLRRCQPRLQLHQLCSRRVQP
jgi:G:T/U-mismatch repair DNA glycosylase